MQEADGGEHKLSGISTRFLSADIHDSLKFAQRN
jgi:hypothetical protein